MKHIIATVLALICSNIALADELTDATQLYESARIVCSGISDEIRRTSGMSVAGAVVGGASAGVATGALVVGITKADLDAQIEAQIQKMCNNGGCDINTMTQMSDESFLTRVLKPMAEISRIIEQATQKSKQLGNWRTGLMSGTIATNLANTILAGLNRNQSDLIQQIQACNSIVAQLSGTRSRLIAAGINPLHNPIVNKIDGVTTWCQQIDISDIEKIEKRMNAVMGTAIAGTAIGVAGTATSAAANSNKIRTDDSEHGKQKEKNLNTASNVLAGANIVTGATEMGFSISAASLSKKLIKQAKLCEEAF